jgi:hypothetical protein
MRKTMRTDIQKVIVERPRLLRGRWKNKKTGLCLTSQQKARALDAAEDYDSGPGRAPSRQHEKKLNENLAPLERYLMRQVGRPWDKVYGEIRGSIDARSATGLHVLQHLPDYVAVKTFLKNGEVFSVGRWGGASPVRGLYVDPKSRLLRFPKPRAKKCG